MTTYTINGSTLLLQQGNIVNVQADAIVNAANAALAGGGGVDGAIHRAAGPTIMRECRQIGGCATGSAVATGAGNLSARYIFHAVGPIYQNSGNEPQLLASAYQTCLNLAEEHQLQSIAFPSLSTGAYGYPLHLAAPIALRTVITHLQQPTSLKQVYFILFDQRTLLAYQQALQKLLGGDQI
ncbi:O-acetyl-ADP-ribose deacetylase [Dictyobacter aurantiacus]|uniref:O-acetyl-ADP-ribose deacetylase n=1 Tax=Dictyobacter aurantiacus TaxID=1936993 RepID=A0A401ZC72_9CHLR|nr:O-acetyl-ADP-ribose deacetylase [Dictyobacter aurantiacus]GCE04318.1 O-acetyl-ADP-ribose deacetylase [Dictyobacter aurantiacus]